MAAPTASRNKIVGMTDNGLVLQIDSVERVAPWSAIMCIDAVMALIDRTSHKRIPVLVFGIMDGADERVFLVGEAEQIWESLTLNLAKALPDIPPIEVWRAVLSASGMASLYCQEWHHKKVAISGEKSLLN